MMSLKQCEWLYAVILEKLHVHTFLILEKEVLSSDGTSVHVADMGYFRLK